LRVKVLRTWLGSARLSQELCRILSTYFLEAEEEEEDKRRMQLCVVVFVQFCIIIIIILAVVILVYVTLYLKYMRLVYKPLCCQVESVVLAFSIFFV